MVGLAKELDGKPFHWISSHSKWPDGPKKQEAIEFVDKLTKDLGNFSMIAGTKHPDIRQKGIPFFAVFDHHGNLVDQFKGHPANLEQRLRDMVDEVPGLYLGKHDYKIEAVAQLATKAETNVPPGRVLKDIQTVLEDAEQSAAHVEAEDLKRRILEYGAKAKERVAKKLYGHPDKALDELKVLVGDFKGSAFGDELKEFQSTTKADKTFKANRKALLKFNRLREELMRLKSCGSCKAKAFDVACGACREKNASGISSMIKKLEKLERSGADLPVMKQVRELIGVLGG